MNNNGLMPIEELIRIINEPPPQGLSREGAMAYLVAVLYFVVAYRIGDPWKRWMHAVMGRRITKMRQERFALLLQRQAERNAIRATAKEGQDEQRT